MTRKQHLLLGALFVAVNLLGAFLNSNARDDGRALDDQHYEDASDDELVAASRDAPIVCVAASTPSGCG